MAECKSHSSCSRHDRSRVGRSGGEGKRIGKKKWRLVRLLWVLMLKPTKKLLDSSNKEGEAHEAAEDVCTRALMWPVRERRVGRANEKCRTIDRQKKKPAPPKKKRNQAKKRLTKIYRSIQGHKYGTRSQNLLFYSSTKSKFSKRHLAQVKDPS